MRRVRIEQMDTSAASALIDRGSLTAAERVNLNGLVMMTTKAWVGFVDDVPVAIWGICPPSLIDTICYLWMHVTAEMKGHEFLLVRHSQRVIELIQEDFSIITGLTDLRNHKAIRWLEWLGAKFGPPNDFGLRRFIIERQNGRPSRHANNVGG